MTQITKELTISIRSEIEDALKSVGVKHGLVFTTGSAGYMAGEDGNIRYQLNAVTVKGDGSAGPTRKEKQAMTALPMYGRMDCIPENRLAGAPFSIKGKDKRPIVIKLVGYSGGKSPYIMEEISTKKRYVAPKETILAGVDA